MFNLVKTLTILAAVFAVGQADYSHGQEVLGNGSEKNNITIGSESCAEFIWLSHSKIPRLVSVDGKSFGFTLQSGPVNYTRISEYNADEFGDWTRNSFDVSAEHLFELKLSSPRQLAGAILYDSGTLTIRNEDGRLQVESVKATISCNPSWEASVIGFDESTQKFRLPYWLKKPEFTQVKDDVVPFTQAPIVPPENPVLAERVEAAPMLLQSAPAQLSTAPTDYSTRYEVQLAAFREEDRALQHLDKLRNLASYIYNYEPEIQSAERPDLGFIYRLRLTGFADKTAALNLCERLKNDGVDCFVP